ncbi:MAG: TPM domain-containing protein [Cytophagaceae bacterium]
MGKEFINDSEQELIVQAIRDAEKNTSGEIQVHVENHCKGNVLDRAADVFSALNMHKTDLRNGVLIYLAVKDHQFAILGDAGINEKVPDDFWEKIKDHMQDLFRQGKFTQGLCEGIRMAGEQLKVHFPFKKGDINELPDQISFENN